MSCLPKNIPKTGYIYCHNIIKSLILSLYFLVHWQIVFISCVHTVYLTTVYLEVFATAVRKIHLHQNASNKTSIILRFLSKSSWCLDNIFVLFSSKKLYRKGFFAASAYRLRRTSLTYIFQMVYTLFKRAIAWRNWFVWALGETRQRRWQKSDSLHSGVLPRSRLFFVLFFFKSKLRALLLWSVAKSTDGGFKRFAADSLWFSGTVRCHERFLHLCRNVLR